MWKDWVEGRGWGIQLDHTNIDNLKHSIFYKDFDKINYDWKMRMNFYHYEICNCVKDIFKIEWNAISYFMIFEEWSAWC